MLHSSQHLISISLLSVGFFQLLHLHLHIDGSGIASITAVLIMLAVALPNLSLCEKVLVTLAFVAIIFALVLSQAPLELFERAGLQAAFLTAFMVLLTLLRDGAVTSSSVLKLGQYLTSRSPGRRYLAIHCGGHLLGMVLNFGALTLLGPLIQRGARSVEAGNEALTRWREQRQISALMRGFSWAVAWSPATVSMAITVSVVKGTNLLLVCLYGSSTVFGALLIRWLLDRNTGRQVRAALPDINRLSTKPNTPDSFPSASVRSLGVVCLTLFLVSIFTMMLSQSRIVPALMLASPLVTVEKIKTE